MKIGKNPEMQQTGTAEQPKNSETTTENLTQSSQMPEESPIKLKVERDILVQSFEKAKEFMRTQKKQIQTLEEEKQMILSDRQRSMGYQDSGNRSCAFYIGNRDDNNCESGKTIQKNVG